MSANATQVGGNHYKTGGEEHWDRVNRLGLDYFQGQITKYVERWKKKNGVEDLKKAQHFLAKYIEIAEAAADKTMAPAVALRGDLPPAFVYEGRWRLANGDVGYIYMKDPANNELWIGEVLDVKKPVRWTSTGCGPTPEWNLDRYLGPDKKNHVPPPR